MKVLAKFKELLSQLQQTKGEGLDVTLEYIQPWTYISFSKAKQGKKKAKQIERVYECVHNVFVDTKGPDNVTFWILF